MIPPTVFRPQAPISPESIGNRSRSNADAANSFNTVFQRIQRNSATIRRRDGENTPPAPATPAAPTTFGPGMVVVSPFNPLGLPISGTLAPTAAEVAANPDRWRGTSFDPAIRFNPVCRWD